jgi:hypothetical protein
MSFVKIISRFRLQNFLEKKYATQTVPSVSAFAFKSVDLFKNRFSPDITPNTVTFNFVESVIKKDVRANFWGGNDTGTTQYTVTQMLAV